MDLLRALGTFVRVVETGSFSAVARESNSNHSAVTRLVSQLEEHFGARLFHRTTRRLSLTEDGEDLLSQARHLLETATDLEDALMGRHGTPVGRVRLGLPVGAARLLTPQLGTLIARYPGLIIELVVRDTVEDMIEERLDIALRMGQPTDATLVTRSVGSFGQALVAAPTYLERHGAPSQPDDLLHHTCLLHDLAGSSSRWFFNGPDGVQEIEVTSSFRANNGEVVRQAALSGLGIGRLPEPMIVDDIRSGRLYRLLPDYPSELRQAYLVYPSRRHLPPRTRLVLDFLVEQFAALSGRLADSRVWGENETVWLV